MHVINHEWNRSMFVASAMCFVWDIKPDLPTISTCSHPRPFCLCPRDNALAANILTPCVYMQRQRQETNKQAMEGKGVKSEWKRHNADKHDRHGKHNRKAIKQAKKKTSKKQTSKQENKQKSNKRWCPRGTNVGLHRVSIASLCWSMDDTLASKTCAWTCKKACKDAYKANRWHTQAWQAYHCIKQKRGKVCMKQPASWRCVPSGCIHTTTHPLRPSSVAMPRTREANTSIKHKSKQV